MIGPDPHGDTVLQRYSKPAIGLHWLVAVLIVIVGAIGLYFGWARRGEKPFWLNLHATVGMAMLIAICARVVYRLAHRPPPLPDGTSRIEEMAAKGAHFLMYVLMVAIPAAGLVAFIWHARIFDFGAFQVDLGVTSDRSIFHPAQSIHKWLAYGFFIVVGLHVLAAVWRQFILRDHLLERMLFPQRSLAIETEDKGSEGSNHVHSA